MADGKRFSGVAGVLSSAGTGLLAMGSGILLLPLVLMTIGSAPYGVWLVVTSVATYAQFADLGIGTAITHFASRSRGSSRQNSAETTELLSSALLWTAAASLLALPIVWVATAFYVSWVGGESGLTEGQIGILPWLGVLATAPILVRPFVAALTGAGLLPIERLNQGISVVVRVAGTLVACIVGDLLLLAIVEIIAFWIPGLLAMGVVFKRRIARVYIRRHSIRQARELLSYSSRAFGVSALGGLLLQSGTIIAGIVVGPSGASYYSAAFRIYLALRQVLSWLVDPFRSVLSRLFAQNHREGVTALLRLSSFVTLLAAGIGVAVSLSGTVLVGLWLGDRGSTGEVALTLAVLSTGLVVNSVQLPLAFAGDAIGRPGAFLLIQFSWLVLAVVLGVVLGSVAGPAGIAAGFTLPLVVITPLYVVVAARLFKYRVSTWAAAVLAPASLPISIAGFAALATFGLSSITLSTGVSAALGAVAWSAAFGIAVVVSPMHNPRQLVRFLRHEL